MSKSIIFDYNGQLVTVNERPPRENTYVIDTPLHMTYANSIKNDVITTTTIRENYILPFGVSIGEYVRIFSLKESVYIECIFIDIIHTTDNKPPILANGIAKKISSNGWVVYGDFDLYRPIKWDIPQNLIISAFMCPIIHKNNTILAIASNGSTILRPISDSITILSGHLFIGGDTQNNAPYIISNDYCLILFGRNHENNIIFYRSINDGNSFGVSTKIPGSAIFAQSLDMQNHMSNPILLPDKENVLLYDSNYNLFKSTSKELLSFTKIGQLQLDPYLGKTSYRPALLEINQNKHIAIIIHKGVQGLHYILSHDNNIGGFNWETIWHTVNTPYYHVHSMIPLILNDTIYISIHTQELNYVSNIYVGKLLLQTHTIEWLYEINDTGDANHTFFTQNNKLYIMCEYNNMHKAQIHEYDTITSQTKLKIDIPNNMPNTHASYNAFIHNGVYSVLYFNRNTGSPKILYDVINMLYTI